MFLNLDRQEDSSDWLLTDNVSSWPGTSADRGWRYLRQTLERHDNAETDYKYTKVAFDTIIAFNGTTRPPLWLVRSLEVSGKWPQHFSHVIHPPPKAHDPEYLIRTYLRYEAISSALAHTLSLIRKVSRWLLIVLPSIPSFCHHSLAPRSPGIHLKTPSRLGCHTLSSMKSSQFQSARTLDRYRLFGKN